MAPRRPPSRYAADGDSGSMTLEAFAASAPRYNQALWKLFERAVGRRVLEVGSGIGTFTQKLLPGRELVIATDSSSVQVDRLRGRFATFPNVRVEPLDLNDVPVATLLPLRIDTVFCSNVLEHVEDDREALEQLREVVIPGGVLLLFVPAHEALYGAIDKQLGHFRRYERRELKRLLEVTGWSVESLRSFNVIGALGWLMNGRVLRRRTLVQGQLALYDRLLVPLLRLERLLDPPFGCSLAVVARRPS